MQIGNYTAEGVYPLQGTVLTGGAAGMLKEQSGVYVILKQTTPNNYSVVDIGESEAVRGRVLNHDRKPCWLGQTPENNLFVAPIYLNVNERMAAEGMLRAQYNPPCGER